MRPVFRLAAGTFDLNEIPLGQALVSAAAILVFLRVSPKLARLDRTPVLGRLVTLLTARAVTVYLWHNVAIDLSYPVDDWLGWSSQPVQPATAAVLTAVAVLAFGWVEGLAARRPPQLLPGARRKPVVPAVVPGAHLTIPVVPVLSRLAGIPRGIRSEY